MKKVVFIIPYYGKLPSNYTAWELTALYNANFDFLFITDIKDMQNKANIHVIHMSFDELRDRFQKMLNKNIVLNNAYKLCDYKPAYGYLFEEYIREYDFWGHCDIDTLLGDLSAFITTEKLERFDKIYEHGHMTLYRNTEWNNKCFMSMGSYPEMNFDVVYSSPESFYFDEFYGMMLKNRRIGTNTYLNTKDFVDIDSKKCGFHDVHSEENKEMIFEWNSGKLYRIMLNENSKFEIAYAHFQKREVAFLSDIVKENFRSHCYIMPNKISEKPEYTGKTHLEEIIYAIRVKLAHIEDFWKRYKRSENMYSSLIEYYKSRQQFKKQRKEINLLLEK